MYFVLILAYISVKWCKIFTPEQTTGISRYLRFFAIPLLSFKVISSNNLYAINCKLFAADSLQKIVSLAALFLWKIITKKISIEWIITFYSLSSLPNTLIMGLPISRAMYGDESASLMVQTMVFQSIIWSNILLFLMEYRAAKLSISDKFPDHNNVVVRSSVGGGDSSSIKGFESLPIDVGKISGEKSTEELSNLSGVELYSAQSSVDLCSRDSSSKGSELNEFSHVFPENKRSFSNNGDHIFSVNSSEKTTPDLSFDVDDEKTTTMTTNKQKLHMFVWNNSSTAPSQTSTVSEENFQTKQEHVGTAGADSGRFEVIFDASKDAGFQSDTCSRGKKMEMRPSASLMTKFLVYRMWTKISTNPNTYASLLGVAWSLLSFKYHIKLPKVLGKGISLLSDTGLTLAMFSLGTFMAAQPNVMACSIWETICAMAVRYIISPSVISVTSKLVGLHGIALKTAIVQAAFPQANMSFIFAKEYNVNPHIISTMVTIGMLIALPVVLLFYLLLGAILT